MHASTISSIALGVHNELGTPSFKVLNDSPLPCEVTLRTAVGDQKVESS